MRKAILIFTAAFFSLAWACSNPGISPTSSAIALPAARMGMAYSAPIATAGTWNYSGGVLPRGLRIDGDFVVGTALEFGRFTFLAAATTATGTSQNSTNTFSLCVAPAKLAVTTTTLPGAFLGVAYSDQLTAGGGTAPFTWAITSGALPAGVTLSRAGLLSGKPTATGNFSFVVTVTDSSTFSCSGAVAGLAAQAQSATMAVRM